MKISTQNIWTAAGSISQPVPFGPGGVLALPAVDSGNVSLLVTNTGGTPVWFNLQTDQVIRPVANAPGCLEIAPGATLLFAPAEPADYSNAVADTATFSSVASYAGGNLTFTRGTVTTQTVLQ